MPPNHFGLFDISGILLTPTLAFYSHDLPRVALYLTLGVETP